MIFEGKCRDCQGNTTQAKGRVKKPMFSLYFNQSLANKCPRHNDKCNKCGMIEHRAKMCKNEGPNEHNSVKFSSEKAQLKKKTASVVTENCKVVSVEQADCNFMSVQPQMNELRYIKKDCKFRTEHRCRR
ncbi:hypothetical protein niasHT_004480 [Heterodera trifolii]|uniref:Uncharacterized protein n=1 Tax=Heterodera trifolii TaxID=157864 RepID=A0ABD2MDI3_9BILA